jgi:hypothetical protein
MQTIEEVVMINSKYHYARALPIILLLFPIVCRAADVSLLMDIMQCESSLRYNVWGDDGKSYGIAQFRKETFYEFASLARQEMKAEKLWPAQWALDHGYGNRWTCYRKIRHEKSDPRRMVEYQVPDLAVR